VVAEPPEAMVALGPRSGRSGMAKAKGGSSATNMVIFWRKTCSGKSPSPFLRTV